MNAAEHETRDDTRLTQASEWFVRLRESDVTTEEIAAWLSWRKEHPDNERAFSQVQEMWSLSGDAGVADWPDAMQVRTDTYEGEVSVGEWRKQLQVAARNAQRPPLPPTGEDRGKAASSLPLPRAGEGWGVGLWTRRALALAASLALAIGLWTFRDVWLPAPDSGVFITQRGDTRTIHLADGSQVTLGGASTVRVAFQEQRRGVSLDRGEAFFKVARDKTRPFVVHAGDLRVTAIGTAFTVRADDVRTVVAVTEGVVEVVPITATSPPATTDPRRAPMIGAIQVGNAPILRARAGEQVTYDANRKLSAIQPSDDAIAIGWQEGALTSVDEPLRAVVARLNRYSKREIVLADGIADLRFTGTVFEDQIPEWAAGLERVFPIQVIEEADGRVRLEPR